MPVVLSAPVNGWHGIGVSLLGRVHVVLVDDEVVRARRQHVVQPVDFDLGLVAEPHPDALRVLLAGGHVRPGPT